MTTADGADHRRLRGLVTQAFTGRRVAALRPRIAELTAGLLDALPRAADADGTVDLRRHFAYPLPMGVICELLGVDPALRDRLHELSNLIVGTAGTAAEVLAANREITALLTEVAEARRADPGDDLTSALLAAREEDGDRLSAPELVGTLLSLIIAGHETTLNLITNAVRALCTDRGQLELVLAGRASWDDVVEETLRYDSPVAHFPFRYPVRDLEIGGTLVPRGTPMLASYAAAGRDPDAYGATRTGSTSPGGPPPGTSPSATARTTAWARRWPGWRRPWPSRRCSPGIRRWTSPSRTPSSRRTRASSATAPTSCRSGSPAEHGPVSRGCRGTAASVRRQTRRRVAGQQLRDLAADHRQRVLVALGRGLNAPVDPLGDQRHPVRAQSAGGEGRGADADAGGVEGLAGVEGDGVVVDDDAGPVQGLGGDLARDVLGGEVDQHQVVVVPPETRS